MRCMLYVICCWLCILGQVDAILGVYCEHFGATWIYLVAILGNVGAIFGPLWEVLGALGSTLELRVQGFGFKVWGLGFDHPNTYLIEMQKSLLTYACAAKTLA